MTWIHKIRDAEVLIARHLHGAERSSDGLGQRCRALMTDLATLQTTMAAGCVVGRCSELRTHPIAVVRRSSVPVVQARKHPSSC